MNLHVQVRRYRTFASHLEFREKHGTNGRDDMMHILEVQHIMKGATNTK
ncbi:MAG: hypothetical protein WA667_07440 [Candidatus Nitrosopolaris sp.]